MKVKDICILQNGRAFKPEDWGTEGLPIIRIQNLNDETAPFNYFSGDYNSVHEVNDGELLFSWSGTPGTSFGAFRWYRGKGILNQHIFRVIPIIDIDKDYLKYALNGNISTIISKAHGGVGLQHITKKELDEIDIPVVPARDQNFIVSNLVKIERIIAFRQRQLRMFDNLIKARFVELFGECGKVVPLTDYVWFQEGPGVRSADFTDDGTILLTGSNINDNEISFGYKSDRFISDELANGKYAHFICDKDDILVVSSAIAPEKFDKKVTIVKEDKKYCLNTGIIRFKPDLGVLTLGYFREFLKTDYFKHQVMAEMRGIAQMHFGPSHLKQMTILLPESLELQIEFEKFVKEVDKSKSVAEKALKKAEVLFDNLMQQYFG